MPISTRSLNALPNIAELKRLMQSLAMLDAIILPGDEEDRYHTFDAKWGKNKQVGVINNGSGDHVSITFQTTGCLIKGFAHESAMSPFNADGEIWAGVVDDVPKVFHQALREPAFAPEETTFCIWRLATDDAWQTGTIKFSKDSYKDGSQDLLALLDGKPSRYKAWAEDYFEDELEDGLPLRVIKQVYAHEPLTDEIIKAINPSASLKKLAKEIRTIGYSA